MGSDPPTGPGGRSDGANRAPAPGPSGANLIFELVSARFGRASMIVPSNKPFSGWGEIFGDVVVAAAMIDRLVHHAGILSLKGDSDRLRDKDVATRSRPALIDES